jgi:hypothetical protein
VVVAMAVGACGGGDDGPVTGSQIFVIDRASSGRIAAWFYDHDLPGELVLAADGSCEFHALPLVTCDPACGDGQTCTPDGTCADDQRLVSVGTLTVDGTSAGNHAEIERSQLGTYELQSQSSLLGGPTQVEISATGSDDFPAFTITLDAPPNHITPEGSSEPGWPSLAAGQDLVLSWGSGHADSRVRVALLDDSGAATIFCDAADTGSLTVPGSLISDFLATGDFSQAGGGLSAVEAYRRTSVDVDGHRIDLLISSGTEFWAVPDP